MKGLFHKDRPIAGIDISTTGVKIMAINPAKMTVLGFGSVDLDPHKVQESIINGNDYLQNGLRTLLAAKINGHIPSRHVAVSVPTSRTYSRTMSLPLDAEKNLSEAINLEAEQYIPIPIDELSIDYEIVERTKDSLTVLLSAVPKKIVQSITKACSGAGLKVVMVEPGLNAAARLITVTEQGHLPSVIIDVGAATTDVALLDGVVRVTGGVPVGGHTFTYRIAERLKVSLEEAHQLKVHSGLVPGAEQERLTTALAPSLNHIVAETRKIVRYYTERLGAKTKVEQVVVVGGGSNMPGLGDYLTDSLLMPTRVADPWSLLHFGHLQPPSHQFKPRFITAAGLAIIPPKEIWS